MLTWLLRDRATMAPRPSRTSAVTVYLVSLLETAMAEPAA